MSFKSYKVVPPSSNMFPLEIPSVFFLFHRTLAAEVEVFLSVDHPHVCRLFDVYEAGARDG